MTYIRTSFVSVVEFDDGYVQSHCQIDRPPWVCFQVGMCTVQAMQYRSTVSVVSIVGRIWSLSMAPCTGLNRRTIECHIDIKPTINCHWTPTQLIISDQCTLTAHWLSTSSSVIIVTLYPIIYVHSNNSTTFAVIQFLGENQPTPKNSPSHKGSSCQIS